MADAFHMLFILENTFLNGLEWPRLTMTGRRMARQWPDMARLTRMGNKLHMSRKDIKQNINKTNL